jgi:peptide/nickel transport system ATP-binding protein
MTVTRLDGEVSRAPVLRVNGLRVETSSGEAIVEDVSLVLGAGEVLGIVGESGSGKTTTAMALLGATSAGAVVTAGEIVIGGETIDANDEKAARRHRGRTVSYVPQNPGTSLNPSMRIGQIVAEMLRAHRPTEVADDAVADSLRSVSLPTDLAFRRRYPHQLSGGQQQRVCIAVSLICRPPLVVLDEPTTGLDVVTQAAVLAELKRLRQDHGVAMVYVTHDLGVVAQLADRIAVMYAGRIVEEGPAQDVLQRPRHPYSRGLVKSIPDHGDPRELEPMPGIAVGVGDRPSGCAFAPRCALVTDACQVAMPELRPIHESHLVRCLHPDQGRPLDERAPLRAALVGGETPAVLALENLRIEHHGRGETVVAADDVSIVVPRSACVALVGESGSGKTSIANAVVGLQSVASGRMLLDGVPLSDRARARTREQRRRIQIVFQNPADSLNPRMSVRKIIGRPAQTLLGLSHTSANAEVLRLLELVRLPSRTADRYPMELSGGERQRVAIARALAARPDVLICDEITSALDVSVQAAVLSLLRQLRDELDLSILFITHDLGVVAAIAEQVVVLQHGRVCESGRVEEVLQQPRHPYSRTLLESAPSISRALLEDEDSGAPIESH